MSHEHRQLSSSFNRPKLEVRKNRLGKELYQMALGIGISMKQKIHVRLDPMANLKLSNLNWARFCVFICMYYVYI